jgi:F0F1-type ATP synthase alpha subunit
MIIFIGISIVERLKDRSYDSCICFDDLSKHSKSYRQISLILGKIPSRDAFPADTFNIHSSLLERCGKLKYNIFIGSITGLPIIETINSDITEYIATNIISITDGQFYTNKRLFLDSCRPAIDSGLSVSRIGSNAQCKLIKIYSYGLKNLLTNYRNSSLNLLFFHDHLIIFSLEISLFLLIFLRMDF